MPYILQQVPGNNEPLAVPERQWGDGEVINFGEMTSCIAVIARSAGEGFRVRGIHLSIVSNDETPVYDPESNVLQEVNNIMNGAGDLRACLGRIDFWQNNQAEEVQTFFINLMQQLGILTWVQLPDGQLNVRANMAANTIQYQQGAGAWIDIPYAD